MREAMRCSIIGANSYIARNLIHYMKDKNVEMFLYDCQETHKDGLEDYEQIDILNTDSLKKVKFDVDIIYMFIGKTGTAVGFESPEVFIDINEKALLNLLNEYRLHEDMPKLIFPSSRLVYKGQASLLVESAEKEAKTIYAMNKIACENYLRMYNYIYGIPYCILRICVPFGTLVQGASSYGTAEFMLDKAKKGENITLYGQGKVRRTFTYIADLCESLYRAGKYETVINDVYNVGGISYSLYEVAHLISKAYGVGMKLAEWPEMARLIESGDTVFDFQKIEKLIGNIRYRDLNEWLQMCSS